MLAQNRDGKDGNNRKHETLGTKSGILTMSSRLFAFKEYGLLLEESRRSLSEQTTPELAEQIEGEVVESAYMYSDLDRLVCWTPGGYRG